MAGVKGTADNVLMELEAGFDEVVELLHVVLTEHRAMIEVLDRAVPEYPAGNGDILIDSEVAVALRKGVEHAGKWLAELADIEKAVLVVKAGIRTWREELAS